LSLVGNGIDISRYIYEYSS